VKDSTAKSMDLREGDVITAIDGADLADFAALRASLAKKQLGEEIAVRVKRGEETIEKKAQLAPAKLAPAFERKQPHGTIRAEAKDGRIDVACLASAPSTSTSRRGSSISRSPSR